MKKWLLLSTGLVMGLHIGFAKEPVAKKEQLPRLAPSEPEEALKKFEIKEGFRIELAAAEPRVVDPVSMSFDADGRLYVVEMIGYSEHREDKLGRVRLLEDVDGNGTYEKSTVFAEGLAWPTGVHCWKGGVFVVVTPDLLYFRDSDGDGVADERKVIFTGFGKGRSRLNMQALPNSLRWGLDNRIYGVTSSNGAVLTNPNQPNTHALHLRGSDFSFDPETLDLRMEMGGGQHGASFDDFGNRYVCSNSRHIQAILYDARYARNARYSMPKARISIAPDGDAAPVFRISPDEPWRIVRTRWRIAGKVRGPVEGGGRVSGYFTAATGITLYRGGLFGVDFQGNAFIADTGSNLLHRKVLQSSGDVLPAAVRAESEKESEFLVSPDNWFRPVQLANGPDGALYILDMYREVIEHPWSLPQGIKSFLDLNSGNDRGRIWRIVPEGFQSKPLPRLSTKNSGELVGFLSSPNAWVRETASRLLFERQEVSVQEDLAKLAMDGSSPLGRLQALYVLAGLGVLQEEQVLHALRDKEWFVRKHALRLSEAFLTKNQPSDLAQEVLKLAKDESIQVRFQLALTLGVVALPGELQVLLKMLAEEDPRTSIQPALHNALSMQADAMFTEFEARDTVEDAWVLDLAASLQAGGFPLQKLPKPNREFLGRLASGVCMDETRSATARLEAVKLLKTLDVSHAISVLDSFLKSKDAALRNGARQLHPSQQTNAPNTLLAQPVPTSSKPRQEIIRHYLPALKLPGVATRGKAFFQQRCALCHKAKDSGHELGPDLSVMKAGGREKILNNLIDPNREISADFEAYQIRTKQQVHLGLLANETPTHLTIRFPLGQSVTLLRKEVLGMKSHGRSIMPENLENGLSHQDMADLLEFLMTQ